MKLPLAPALVFLSLLGALVTGVGLILATRLVGVLQLPAPWDLLGYALVAAWLLLLVGGAILPRLLGKGPVTDRLAWAGFLAMGLLGLVLPLLGMRDLAFLAWDFVSGHRALASAAALAPDPTALRLATGVLGLVAFGLVGLGLKNARSVPAVREVEVPIRDLPPGLHGLRIVQLTDVHVGPTIDREFLLPIVAKVNALKPDLVVITGDLVDGSVHDLGPHVAPLAGLVARHGVVFVTGNHEYYSGAEAWVAELRRLGIEVLLNRHLVLEHEDGARLVLAGVTDHDAGRMLPAHKSDPAAALAGAPPGLPRVLLAHQPRTALQAQGLGLDLQISGHTHGGQIWPWMHLVRLQQPVTAGLQAVGDVLVYTSRGTGTWGPPMRVGAPSELSLLRLVPAPASPAG